MDNTRRGAVATHRGKVVLKSAEGRKIPAQLSSEFGVHANKICYEVYLKPSIYI
jgi:hypothetical protein